MLQVKKMQELLQVKKELQQQKITSEEHADFNEMLLEDINKQLKNMLIDNDDVITVNDIEGEQNYRDTLLNKKHDDMTDVLLNNCHEKIQKLLSKKNNVNMTTKEYTFLKLHLKEYNDIQNKIKELQKQEKTLFEKLQKDVNKLQNNQNYLLDTDKDIKILFNNIVASKGKTIDNDMLNNDLKKAYNKTIDDYKKEQKGFKKANLSVTVIDLT